MMRLLAEAVYRHHWVLLSADLVQEWTGSLGFAVKLEFCD